MDHEVQGSIPARGKTFFYLSYMDTKECEVIGNYRPTCRGPFVAAGLKGHCPLVSVRLSSVSRKEGHAMRDLGHLQFLVVIHSFPWDVET